MKKSKHIEDAIILEETKNDPEGVVHIPLVEAEEVEEEPQPRQPLSGGRFGGLLGGIGGAAQMAAQMAARRQEDMRIKYERERWLQQQKKRKK